MERKELTAFLIDCDSDEFMAYADLGESGTVVVGPDGKKFRFSNEQLKKAKKLAEEKIMQMTLEEAAKEPAPPAPKRKPAAKKKAAPRKKSKPAPKTA